MNKKRILLGIISVFLCVGSNLLLAMEPGVKQAARKNNRQTIRLQTLCGGNKDSHKKAALLIQQGANPCYEDAMGISLLHYAAQNGNVNILTVLDCQGASLCARKTDYLGRTPLLLASAQGHINV